jgi:hypothetical protein
MPHFVVRFYKNMVGDQGQLCECCQQSIDLDARDETEAAVLGKRQFCAKHAISDWTLHADRIAVEPADFPS